MKVAVVGATGLVGSMMCRVLEERKFPVSEFIPVSSERSAGTEISFHDKKIKTILAAEAINAKPDIALFSAGGNASLELAPQFKNAGCTVIDNSSAWRMHPEVPLVVPEINADVIEPHHRIIANPNCSTIQMVMVLNPLHKKYKINRVVVSTYQSVTGTGKAAVDQLINERQGVTGKMAYPYPIDMNILPQVDVFLENGYTKEEMKMVNETKKIMRDASIAVTATTVRVPVMGGHSEAVNIEFDKDFDLTEVRSILHNTKGLIMDDEPSLLKYPMPLTAKGKDEVFVGRIRRDESRNHCLNLWIVADNLRKGAATNAVQIAEYIREKFHS
ncbi:MAG: aspartate-semialdehyde dehydrogenase [Bacteroidia bacterium]|nr:aspartate-semialdehyde dehydrogenase [Bacteroidia bacterium]